MNFKRSVKTSSTIIQYKKDWHQKAIYIGNGIGHPTLTLSVLLFSLLVSSGIGSLFSERLGEGGLAKRVAYICFAIAALVIVYIIGLQSVINVFLGNDISIRISVSILLLFPLGFLMGIPFPTGMKMINRVYEKDIPWMWGINGSFSVLGSVLAVWVAISAGFTIALFLGALSYFLIFVAFRSE